MADSLKLATLNLANHTGKTWRKNIRGGVLAALSAQEPDLKVGATDVFTFTGTPKAELVGESQPKSSADGTPTKVTVKTYKVQITYRMSNEVQFEDEDYQTQIVDNLVANVATALSRAVDLLAIHGINPATGTVSSAIANYFTKSGNGVFRVTATSDGNADLSAAAAALQGAGNIANGIAFDPAYAGSLARLRDAQNRPLFPELGFGFGFDSFQGLRAASSDTVSAKQELGSGNAKVKALMGDFNAFQWGIARDLPLRTIEFGDPDGNGDLQRLNEVAIRAESYIGFGIMDPTAFALVTSATGS